MSNLEKTNQNRQSSNIKPYGDTLNDGRMQLSFVLPIDGDERGKEAAKQLLKQMGLYDIEICYVNNLTQGFAHFIVFASTSAVVDVGKISVKTAASPPMTMQQIDDYIEHNIGRELTVIGACIESDAHTVGIDAIMNMKGYNHRFGLERYKCFNAVNLGAQVQSEDLIKEAKELNADAVLVSQVVTQKNIHIANLTKLIELAEAEGIRSKTLFICGGPRINHELAIELGYDAGFGSGTYADEVASFIAHSVKRTS